MQPNKKFIGLVLGDKSCRLVIYNFAPARSSMGITSSFVAYVLSINLPSNFMGISIICRYVTTAWIRQYKANICNLNGYPNAAIFIALLEMKIFLLILDRFYY